MTEIIIDEGCDITGRPRSDGNGGGGLSDMPLAGRSKMQLNNSSISLLEVLDWECEQDNPVEVSDCYDKM